ncbi:MAG: hypothetical protein N4A33_02490 [Bacteriovoracaceae bacterium]|jgi:glucose-6-phosphate isomerase|nr:hypothetical protein [Bacteriovoracaceae bacterium]
MKITTNSQEYIKTNINKQDTFNSFENIINDKRYGFFHLTKNLSHIEKSKDLFEKFKGKKHFVQIGIGGSALGPQMLISALGKNGQNFTFLDNTDSEDIEEKLSKIDLKESIFYVVSKSGGTAETIANFIICYNKLKDLGISDFKNYFVFCTDPNSGQLRAFVNDNNFHALEVPSDIGGRFSVLSSVGVFPALFAGIDVNALYNGANHIADEILDKKDSHQIFEVSHKLYDLYKNNNINQTVLMPYSSKLKDLSFWFVQLWSESLGKEGIGLTPLPAYGATDQHSQVQLFMEGPNDKTLFLLEVENRKINFNLKSDIDLESASKLASFDINSLINAQLQGNLQALEDQKRHTFRIKISENNAFNLGSLILYFEALTAIMGSLLKVDPFNQPGVELGKKYAFEFLNSTTKTADKGKNV